MIFGALRVKNEARWIGKVVAAILPICEEVLILDDHSTDDTAAICRSMGCRVFESPFTTFDESRDKDYLLAKIWEARADIGDYCLMVDGDEELLAEDRPLVKALAAAGKLVCGSFKVLYLWNQPTLIRVDRWYREVRRATMFKLTSRALTFSRTNYGGNLHCSSAPAGLLDHMEPTAARLLHYGYMHRDDRIRKYRFYNQIDPNNEFEDGYRHMVIGDLYPIDSRFKWAGPLEVVRL